MSSIIGASIPQVTGREKVLGLSQYVGDIKMAGMLHAKVLRSPYPHAKIVRIDVSRARALRGVKLVVTGADTPEVRWGMFRKEHRILAAGKVRFAGEEVAAVAAVDEATALDALELIRVEYEELPALLDMDAALAPGAVEVHEGTKNLAREIRISRGDVDEGFRRSAAVYEANYDIPYQYHGYMEPMGTVAAADVNGKVTVWAPTQAVFITRTLVAEALDVPASRVRVIQTVSGGGFGGKNTADNNTPIAAFLALRTRRPVRLVNNRLEDFLAARSNMPARIWLRMGVAADGEILAKESSILGDNGAYTCQAPSVVLNTAMRSDSLHRLRNVRTHARLVFTNMIPTGAFRGMGNTQMTFALNCHLTALAGMIGMDPVDIHLRNAIRAGDTSVHGWKMGSCGLTECIERTRDGIEWKKKFHVARGSGTRKRGLGIASAIHVSGNRNARANWDGSTVTVKINEDGRVTLITGECDVGQGWQTVLSQICSAELGIPIEHITVNQPDTDVASYCPGALASRVTVIAGVAAVRASREARAKLLDMASKKLEVAADDLTIEDGIIHVVGIPEHRMRVAEAAHMHLFRAGGEPITAQATYDPETVPPDENYYGNVAPAYSFAVQAVEVEVDTETGQVRLIDGFCADDCGKALNPMAVEGQNTGAMTQGIGGGLFEALQFEGGRLVNADFADYTLPTAESIPRLGTAIVESMDPNGPYGAKGSSETAIAPTAAAIANAVFDAVGVRINSLPITPEKVLDALRASNHELRSRASKA
jgi:CO/xanthine dehydrogenase Mo-binding subunit